MCLAGGTIPGHSRWESWDYIRRDSVMKSLLIALVAVAGFSLAACEEKNPIEKAADKAEDVIDKAN